MQLISQHMEIKDLDRPTVLEMIESITISEARKVNGKRHQNITISKRINQHTYTEMIGAANLLVKAFCTRLAQCPTMAGSYPGP